MSYLLGELQDYLSVWHCSCWHSQLLLSAWSSALPHRIPIKHSNTEGISEILAKHSS